MREKKLEKFVIVWKMCNYGKRFVQFLREVSETEKIR